MVMASAGVNMPAGAGGDGVGNPTAASGASAAPECRMRRRRRLEPQGSGDWVRRLRPSTSRFSPSSSPSPSQEGSSEQEEEGAAAADPEVGQEVELPPLPPAGRQVVQPAVAEPEPPEPAAVAVPAAERVWPVAFGSLSMAGRMRIMEDTVSIHPEFCTWPPDGSPMHFFAVFDGHGGSHVSALCRERMHEFVAEEMAKEGALFLRRRQEWQQQAASAGDAASTSVAAFLHGPAAAAAEPWSEQAEEERAWRAALVRAFRRVDAMAPLACACGRVTRPTCRCALSPGTAAAGGGSGNLISNGGIVGSTAVVAVLVRGRLIVANCGDSRAVLCRGRPGSPPVPLSFDHKPNRVDEMARIREAGGRVMFNNGFRVRGILAMSRAIGDRLLRPEVIAVPEITFTDRTEEDECLILASDGMWDVIENETACSVARQCLEDWNPAPGDPPAAAAAVGGVAPPAAAGAVVSHQEEPRCVRAASLLARLAMGRDTQDNISIIVVDLKHRE